MLTISSVNALDIIEKKDQGIKTSGDPDCDGRLWLWGPYGGWTGELINFTPTIASLNREDAWRLGECCVDFTWEFGDGKTLSFTCCSMEEYRSKKPNRVSHRYEDSGVYTIRLTVSSPFLTLYDTDKVIIKNTNEHNPCKPTVSYRKVWNAGEYIHLYILVSNDLDNDPVRFYFEFEDGYIPSHPISSEKGWTKYYNSGETANILLDIDDTNGRCKIKTQDICGAESDWINIRPKKSRNLFFLRLIEEFPLFEKIYSYLTFIF